MAHTVLFGVRHLYSHCSQARGRPAATGAPVREALHRKAEEFGARLGERGGSDLFDLLEQHGR